jgi:hypothetical protein
VQNYASYYGAQSAASRLIYAKAPGAVGTWYSEGISPFPRNFQPPGTLAANIYGNPDWAGGYGSMPGATINIMDNNGIHTGVPSFPPFVPPSYHYLPSESAFRQAFDALGVEGCIGSGYAPPRNVP